MEIGVFYQVENFIGQLCIEMKLNLCCLSMMGILT